MLTSIFIASSIAQLLVATHTFIKGRRNFSYLLFFCLSLVTWLWTLFNYLSITHLNSPNLIYIIRAIMVTAVLQTSLFYLFVRQFPDANWIKANKLLLCFGLFTVLAGLVASSPYMFKAVLILDGQAHMVVGLSVAVFTLYLVFTIFAAFKILLGKYFAAIGMKKTQLFILLVAAVLNWVVIPITNFVLTLVLKTTIFAAISSLYGLLFCSIIGYALTKHYLFDFRRMLSDSVIYIDYHLRDARHRTLQYYELQTLIYRAQTNHVALDFSNVKKLDDQSLVMLRTLNRHMQKQGIRLYFTGLTQKVFLQLKLAKILKLKR